MSLRKPKIVVIDDSEIVLEVTKSALEGAGYDVVTHDRPAGCVALILHEKPDLVLMDVNMPGLGGDTIVSVLGKAAPTSDTIVLLHSSLSAEVLRAKVTTAGAHGFMQKSGDPFGLVREVARWLKRSPNSGNMRAAIVTSGDERMSSTRLAAAPTSGSASDSASGLSAARRASGTLRLDAPTVLLVDDDMSVLSGFRRHLQNDDMSIEFALSGGQALRRILSDTPPDAVVCDMLLPDISGIEVYQRAVAAEPSFRQRFAVATGASGTPSVMSFLATFAGPVLHKPIDAAQLSQAVRSCLAGVRKFAKSSVRQ
ncbi:MAG: two component transcriptional regulator, winged helix family [Polyangiaceae bacterium]|nr:two component transcriptional regulator, winged helix family [Polyangiaceae bacterium]